MPNKLFCCANFMIVGLVLLTTVILLYLLYPNVFIREHFQYEDVDEDKKVDAIKTGVALAWKDYMGGERK